MLISALSKSEPAAIFISYPREREDDAAQWQRELARCGRDAFVCHLDAETREPGFGRYPRARQRAYLAGRIQEAAAVAVLWDRNYGRAAWCAWELERAAGQAGKRVFLVCLDGTPVPRELGQFVEKVTSADDIVEKLASPAPLPAPVAASNPRSLDRVALYPAASLLESRLAPRFDAWTRGARELLTMIAWLALSLGAQLATYYGAGRWIHMHGAVSEHLWALIGAINIAMTIVCAFTLSASAATRCGAICLGAALTVFVIGIAWRGEPDAQTVTVAAAAMGMFHVSLVLLLRDRLLGAPLSWRTPPHTQPPPAGALRAHTWSAGGVGVVAVLLGLGLRVLDDAVDLSRRVPQMSPFEKLAATLQIADAPVRLGVIVGLLAGIALSVAVYRRVLGNYRATARYRIAIAAAYGLAACAAVTWFGRAVGAWIQSHIVEAISSWGGSYAGAQVGVLLAVGVAVPIAAGTGRLTVRSERWWGMIGALIVLAIITLKIRSFPFAVHRDGVSREILTGALCGLIPLALVRAFASVRGRIWITALAVHVAAIALLSRGHGSLGPAESSSIEIESIAAATPVKVPQPELTANPPTPPLGPTSKPAPVAKPVAEQARELPPAPAPATQSPTPTDSPTSPRVPTDPLPTPTAQSPVPAEPPAVPAEPPSTPGTGVGSNAASSSGSGVAAESPGSGSDAAGRVSRGLADSAESGGAGQGGQGGGSGSAPPPLAPPVEHALACGGPGAMNPGDVHRCDLAGEHVVTGVALSVGCNDGETAAYTVTLEGAGSRAFEFTTSCQNAQHAIPEVSASRIVVRMNSGGGPDNHISFTCCGSGGLSVTYR